MKYQRFIIRNYRAITNPLTIDVAKHSLMPVIGVNECGKTTILHAIFAFDYFNDRLNDNGRHLRDTRNLYQTSSDAGRIAAEIALDRDELNDALQELADNPALAPHLSGYRHKKKELPSELTIVRSLDSRKYAIESDLFPNKTVNDHLARQLIRRLPYILYFDDFRDSVEERIEIVKTEDGEPAGWLAILERLFQESSPDFSVFKLAKLEERARKSVLSEIKRHLNETLTQEWQNFRLDESEPLTISIEYEKENQPAGGRRSFLKLEIIEKTKKGQERFFFIRDRSKGFFWFFNFVMKLEFNPKILSGDDSDTIYLLDEPGSYLHASAQSKLCGKLRNLAKRNRVIYCTHSHYLLDPEIIPLSTIRVADKDSDGNIALIPLHEHKGSLDRRAAFQPVIDALRIKPYVLDLTQQNVVITEGIFDYYVLEMMKDNRELNFLPSVGADSIPYYVSLMIAWRVKFCALWDNDKAGRKARTEAENKFGEEIAKRHFFLLNAGNSKKNAILQDLFDGHDLRKIKAGLGLPANSSFEKTIASLFFAPERAEILSRLSRSTRDRFSYALDALKPT